MATRNEDFATDGFDLLSKETLAFVARELLAKVQEMEAENKWLRDEVATALADLDEKHRPQWSSDEAAAKGKAPIGCALCWPGDGHWPCSSRLIADDLRAALSGSFKEDDRG